MDELKPTNTDDTKAAETSTPVPGTMPPPPLLPPATAQVSPVAVSAPENPQNNPLVREASVAAAISANGARWFFWIVGLSMINTIINAFNGKMSFVIGLGTTQFCDAFVREPGAMRIIGIMIIAVVIAIYLTLGFFATQRHTWAFIVGMIFYLLDALIYLLVSDYLSIAFHGYVLYCLFTGYKANVQFTKLNNQLLASGIRLKF